MKALIYQLFGKLLFKPSPLICNVIIVFGVVQDEASILSVVAPTTLGSFLGYKPLVGAYYGSGRDWTIKERPVMSSADIDQLEHTWLEAKRKASQEHDAAI